MCPELLKIGPFTLHAFGAMMALGFLAAFAAMRKLARGTGRDGDYLSRLLVWLMIGGIAGARLAYVAEHWRSEFAARPGAVFRIDQGGLMFYGGVFGALAAILLFARRRRENPLQITDLAAAALPLGHAFGRVGCFLNGCCYGRPWEHPLAVAFPAGALAWRDQHLRGLIPADAPRSLPLVPVQLLEAGLNLLIFVVLARLYPRRSRDGAVTAAYLLLYPPARFVTEMLRGDPRRTFGAISIGQTLSLALLFCGVLLSILIRRRPATAAPS
jgi:phosphatidylglycerol:prolipoprotein diacylglycerol transferase